MNGTARNERLCVPLRLLVGNPRDVMASDAEVAQLAIRVALELGKRRLERSVLGPGKGDLL